MKWLAHDPDAGCDDCPLRRGDTGPDYETFWYCGATGEEERDLPSDWSPAPDWCDLRRGPVLAVPPGWTWPEQQTGGPCRITIERRRDHPAPVPAVNWTEVRYPGDGKTYERAPITLVEADGTETEAKPIGGDRYQLPGGRVLRVSREGGSVALWEEP